MNSKIVTMEEISNKLVIVFSMLVIISTIISVIAFVSIDTAPEFIDNPNDDYSSAKASINIVPYGSVKETNHDEATAKASLNIVEYE